MRTGARREEAALTNLAARWLIHWPTDRCIADRRRIRTHVTEFNSQLEVFVLQSSEELKVNIFTLKLSKNISDMQRKKHSVDRSWSVDKLDQLHCYTFIKSSTGALRSSHFTFTFSVCSLSSLALYTKRGSAGAWAFVGPPDNHHHNHFLMLFLLPSCFAFNPVPTCSFRAWGL